MLISILVQEREATDDHLPKTETKLTRGLTSIPSINVHVHVLVSIIISTNTSQRKAKNEQTNNNYAVIVIEYIMDCTVIAVNVDINCVCAPDLYSDVVNTRCVAFS